MILKSLKLQNFRSYAKAAFEFSPQTTVIVGPNGSGKTNILEAIYMLATTKSFRARFDREVISFDQDSCDIAGVVDDIELSIVIAKSLSYENAVKKVFKVGDVNKGASAFAGTLKTVVFRPEDLDILTDGPSLRRNYLDEVLSQTSATYHKAHGLYTKVLSRRNRILGHPEDVFDLESELKYWDQELIANGEIIQTARKSYLNYLNKVLKGRDYHLNYLPNQISHLRLASHFEAEKAAGITLIGPQRDDFEVYEKDRNLATYGSRGEERTAILALKTEELAFITKETSDKPLLLLDDIFSELDDAHKREVVKLIANQQTIITTTDRLDLDTLHDAHIIRLKNKTTLG